MKVYRSHGNFVSYNVFAGGANETKADDGPIGGTLVICSSATDLDLDAIIEGFTESTRR